MHISASSVADAVDPGVNLESFERKANCMRKTLLAAAVGGLLMAMGLSGPASAAPVGAGALAAATERAAPGGVETVHYRPYRHCHWRYGRRWCHGPHFGYYGYGFGPGWGYGGGYYGKKHWKKHHHHHHHNKKWKKKH